MPIYFFDIDDGHGLVPDEDGCEFASLREARDEAARLLPDLVRESLPLGDSAIFSVKIRDASGQCLGTVRLSLDVEWHEAARKPGRDGGGP